MDAKRVEGSLRKYARYENSAVSHHHRNSALLAGLSRVPLERETEHGTNDPHSNPTAIYQVQEIMEIHPVTDCYRVMGQRCAGVTLHKCTYSNPLSG